MLELSANTFASPAQSHDFWHTATFHRQRHLFLQFAAFFRLCKEDRKFEANRRGPILANETEKVAVFISFRIERTADGGGGFKVIGDALRESGSVLAESIASLITVVVAVIPWLIVILPLLWLLRNMWRKYRRGRRADRPPTNQPPAAVL